MQVAGQQCVRRDALYLGGQDNALFACFHAADQRPTHDCVAVICNPIGYEYVHSHRTVRHLADQFAEAGIPALRFDYHGTGDSPGTDLDPDRLSRWLDDIDVAIAAARSLSGRKQVCLVGLRLGTLLAALVSERSPVDYLVLWSPCASGRRYVREMQALALAMENSGAAAPDVLESAGFCMSLQTQEQLRAIDLLERNLRARERALVLVQDDTKSGAGLADHLKGCGIETDVVEFTGYVDMMAEPQNTVVPGAAVEEIVCWVSRHAARCAVGLAPPNRTLATQANLPFSGADQRALQLTETACRFGEGQSLLGIHCRASTTDSASPTVVFFNSGVVHRVGPNRLYVELARQLAAQGFSTFRCDLEGIGDSVLRQPGRENHSYPATASRDAAAALAFLKEHFGATAFVLTGLCSGAYTSFTAGLSAEEFLINELILINPLTFLWKEGTSLDTQHFRAVAHYKGTVRRRESWRKLFSGKVNVFNLLNVVRSYLKKQLESYRNIAAERWVPSAAPILSRQLKQLFEQGRKVTLVVASGDPGWDMLTFNARHTAQRAVKSGDLQVYFIAQADHTFTSGSARQRLCAQLRAHLGARYQG